MIKYEDGKWNVYSADGSQLFGSHDSQEEAIDQEAAIKANQQVSPGKRVDLAKRLPKHYSR